jgi:hypothetical protein
MDELEAHIIILYLKMKRIKNWLRRNCINTRLLL